MSTNTALWDKLGKTDPSHTKPFTRGGGFKGTAIKPMWSYRRMTEEFGPCGLGWGVGEPSFQVVPVGEEVLVYCTAKIWYRQDDAECRVYGVGGDKVAGKFSSGLHTDDEAFKKAFTDAVTNALKLIGVGADVHMGMFDDNKYVNTMKQEFAKESDDFKPTFRSTSSQDDMKEQKGVRADVTEPGVRTANSPVISETAYPLRKGWEYREGDPQAKSSAQLKREGNFEGFKTGLYAIVALMELKAFEKDWSAVARRDGWPTSWKHAACDLIEGHEKAIIDAMDAAELAEVPIDKALKHSIKDNAYAKAFNAG